MQKALCSSTTFRKVKLSMENIYAELLRELRQAIKSKRPGKLTKSVLLHQDNAPALKSLVAMSAVHDCGFELIDHPPYSPDLAPSDSPVALQLRAPPKVSARSLAHRSYHFRGVKLKSCIKKIHHNLYISKQANVRIKHADTEGASHKKFGTDARVQ